MLHFCVLQLLLPSCFPPNKKHFLKKRKHFLKQENIFSKKENIFSKKENIFSNKKTLCQLINNQIDARWRFQTSLYHRDIKIYQNCSAVYSMSHCGKYKNKWRQDECFFQRIVILVDFVDVFLPPGGGRIGACSVFTPPPST